ncbi:acyl-CoA dehydrogenase [Streptomyces sp. NPDC002573]|uniref:acyl-CoA dehydrogenase family protein n=1 Tax=Streptomyces sp. NPDC002573 TaxID=3364651 RepID=UPI0036C939DE
MPPRPGSPVDHCLTSFNQVVLPHEAMLTGEHGCLADDGTFSSSLGSPRKRFLTAIRRVTLGKLCMSAAALGASRAGVATAVRYSHHRHISGPRKGRRVSLWAHRSHHGPLLHALATTYAMNALRRTAVDHCADHDGTDPDAAHAEQLAAVTKGWTTWKARMILIECRERCGAQGLLPVNGIIPWAVDAEGTITAEGDNLAQWAKTGAELLLAADTDDSPAPAPAGRRLDEPAFLQHLLHTAERQHLARARARMRSAPRTDSQSRWNAAAPAALAAVTARAERLAGQALLDTARRAHDPPARTLLHTLHILFALDHLQPRTGALLSDGHLESTHVHHLPEAIEEALHSLQDHALTLVGAFYLPEEVLASRPIANADYQAHFDDPAAHWNEATEH